MKKALLTTAILAAAGFSASAMAGQVTCSSTNGKYVECRLDGDGDIVMKTQLSKSACTKNVDWGETGDGVYVKNGCRAIFETISMNSQHGNSGAYGGSRAAEVTCSSNGSQYVECPLDGSGDIIMKTQLSKAACTKNVSWGETGDGVYVKSGCRGIFTTTGGSNQGGHSGGSSGGHGFNDLIGAKAAGGESDLKARGYSYSWGTTEQNAKVNYWWAPGRKNCIQVTTRDGRFDDIVTVGTDVCEN